MSRIETVSFSENLCYDSKKCHPLIKIGAAIDIFVTVTCCDLFRFDSALISDVGAVDH